ncbi:hypoxanthine phosphoribosyltransferase [Ruminococcaceae bacterium OttesenSCG-928-A16]|nr:hypoxanthine phosphoribosyltransferase [Ruminococcaceae bacterium OttesenSCG-928-A16]
MQQQNNFSNDVERILLTRQQVQKRVEELGAQITRDYQGKDLLMVSVLKGSVVFMADLMRAIHLPAEIDFMMVSSYGAASKSSGVVKIVKDIDIELKGKDLLIVEDILDSGRTLSYLKELLEGRDPASVRIVTLLDKPARRAVPLQPDYTGFEVPDEFIVGYGLDYAEHYRNLPDIGVLKKEVYTKEV